MSRTVLLYKTYLIEKEAIRFLILGGYKKNPHFGSLWHGEASYSLKTSKLSRNSKSEFVIIGGGYTGLSTALHLASKGKEVIVLEAGEIGSGASGLNGGQLNPGLKHNPTELLSNFGSTRGKQILDFAANAPKKTMSIIRKHKIDCDLSCGGFLQPAHNLSSLGIAKSRFNDWENFTDQVEILDRKKVSNLLGTDLYIGGFLDKRGATLNPVKLAKGLAKAALKAGAKIYENALVHEMSYYNNYWNLKVNGFDIKGYSVGIFTNAYTTKAFTPLHKSYVPVQSFQIATQTLPSKIVDKLIPSGFGVSDLNRLLVYYRRGPKNRILIGGRGSLWRPKSVKEFNGLETMLTKVYPILRDIKIEYRWYGNVSITSDFMPKINILGSRAISFLGCNGRGVAISPAIGPYLSDWLINGKDNKLPLPISKNIKTIPLHSIHRLYVALISAYYKARDWVD